MAAIIKPHIRISNGLWVYYPARLGPYAWPTRGRALRILSLNAKARVFCTLRNLHAYPLP